LSSSSGFASGDILYVAPGVYTNQISVTITNPTVETNIIGDPTCTVFTGVSAGPVIVTNYNATLSGVGYTGNVVTATTKNYLHFQNIQFRLGNSGLSFTTCTNLKLTKCAFISRGSSGTSVFISSPTSTAVNITVSRCIFFGNNVSLSISGQNVADNSTITNSLFLNSISTLITATSVQIAVTNCTLLGADFSLICPSGSVTYPSTIRNSVVYSETYDLFCSTVSFTLIENFNRLLGSTPRSNVNDNGTSSLVGDIGLDVGEALLVGLNNLQMYTSYLGSVNTAFGNSTGAPATDIYGVTWTGLSPDAGSGTYRPVGGVGSYQATERNASTITIAPGSTSQSIELYLGVTGLTFSTSGLAAYFVRNREAPTPITLVTQTPTGAWTSGGFAEISSSLVPGVYRLDVPNAAFAAGASDVTIVVRGASGTNGAVLTVTLSSGGLTAAQTAAAVWDEARASHTTAGTFGQYVNAELVTPVTSAALVRMGPFEVRADGLGASDPLDIQTGAQHGVDIQCVDAFGSGIDITSATVTAKVYNSGATLVDTYACTATYAADGRATFTIDTTVTDTPGTYTATITRTTGASDTQVFGPLRIYVRDI
jgi:hypothetical protein